MALSAADRARSAYQASQRSASGQHSIATTLAKGVKSSATNSMLGTATTTGSLGKGLASPASSPASGPPIDPAFEAYRAAAGRNVSLSDAEAKYQQGALSNEYGIGDSSNPYSKAALLQESYNRSKLGTQNSVGGNQIFSGSYQNAQGENDRNYSIGSDALKRAYGQASHGIQYGQAQTYANNALGVDSEKFNALLRALGG